jgi:hypothetical protein
LAKIKLKKKNTNAKTYICSNIYNLKPPSVILCVSRRRFGIVTALEANILCGLPVIMPTISVLKVRILCVGFFPRPSYTPFLGLIVANRTQKLVLVSKMIHCMEKTVGWF